MIKQYIQITKPKIIFGNLTSVISGFFLASQKEIDYLSLTILLISIAIIIASSCILNNLIDKDIDKNMYRTKNRTLITGNITNKKCLIYATMLGVLGFSLLSNTINTLTVNLTILGYVVYVVIYSMYLKRTSAYSTIIGSISGATPPVIGYCANSNNFDSSALILWIIFSVWQIPHFYSLALLYIEDYQTVSIPVFPIKNSILLTKKHIIFYIIIFIITTLLLTLTNHINYTFSTIIELMNSYWLLISLKGYNIKDIKNNKIWAKKMFLLSIFAIIIFNLVIPIDRITQLNVK
ncbi:protoheme IX farnesyltransferase [Blochmannia endosymbiont of Colobopsis nipponica]|nr:protoheme IX farnesyltransferase [Blochmannia endosymbiont of Colobopsis nipponica]